MLQRVLHGRPLACRSQQAHGTCSWLLRRTIAVCFSDQSIESVTAHVVVFIKRETRALCHSVRGLHTQVAMESWQDLVVVLQL